MLQNLCEQQNNIFARHFARIVYTCYTHLQVLVSG